MFVCAILCLWFSLSLAPLLRHIILLFLLLSCYYYSSSSKWAMCCPLADSLHWPFSVSVSLSQNPKNSLTDKQICHFVAWVERSSTNIQARHTSDRRHSFIPRMHQPNSGRQNEKERRKCDLVSQAAWLLALLYYGNCPAAVAALTGGQSVICLPTFLTAGHHSALTSPPPPPPDNWIFRHCSALVPIGTQAAGRLSRGGTRRRSVCVWPFPSAGGGHWRATVSAASLWSFSLA